MEEQRVADILRGIDIKLAELNGQNREWQRNADRRLLDLEAVQPVTADACKDQRAELAVKLDTFQAEVLAALKEKKADKRWWAAFTLSASGWGGLFLHLMGVIK